MTLFSLDLQVDEAVCDKSERDWPIGVGDSFWFIAPIALGLFVSLPQGFATQPNQLQKLHRAIARDIKTGGPLCLRIFLFFISSYSSDSFI